MMWGFEFIEFVILIKDFFFEKNVKNILVLGIGYGRNVKVFIDNGINVIGIEILKIVIDLVRENGLEDVSMYYGLVNEMFFDNKLYDGIFSYVFFYLLNE